MLLVGAVHWAVLLSLAASAAAAASSEASDHIHCSAYAGAAAGGDVSDAGWSHRALVEGYKPLSSCGLPAGGIPSVQVGLEGHTSVAAPGDGLVESLDASLLAHPDRG